MVRPATDADLSAVLELYAQPDFDDGRVLCADDARRLLARFADYPDYVLYVAEVDKKIVGSFALLVMENLGHLGLGVGSRLLGDAHRRLGHDVIKADVSALEHERGGLLFVPGRLLS